MKDTIYRQDAIDAVNELTRWYYETFHEKRPTANAVIDKLMDLPSVEPNIIRCKDCKWKQGSVCVRFADVYPFADDFCSRAERKEDE